MKNLNEEAENYTHYQKGTEQFSIAVDNYKAGATSKYVEEQKIQAQIDVLENCSKGALFYTGKILINIEQKINELKQQLEEKI